MTEMVLLKCDIGSRAATVLCPECGRISRQILLLPYYHDVEAKFIRPHICPICNVTFECCTPNQAGNWLAAFERYNRNADAYNQSTKIDYASKRGALVHSMTSVLSSAAQAVPEKTAEMKYFYCSIDIKGVNFPLFYISDQGSIDRGTVVVVPYGRENEPRIGTVRVCSAFAGNAVPHPVDQTKHVIRIASNADIQELEPTPPLFVENKETPVDDPADQPSTKKALSGEASAVLPEPKEDSISNNTFSESDRETVPATNATGETEAAIDRKIERWKKELLDTGKRNKMINFRETSRSTLRILEPDATELFNKLAIAEKTLTFQKPINKDTDLRTYSMIALMETLSYSLNVQVGDIKTAGTIIEREKTLKNLRSKAKLAQEEQGTNILYLCFGFIYWREKERSSQWNKSPLLMMPVSLGLKSLRSPFTLSRYDDDIQVNPTLEYLFSTEYHINLPPFEAKNRQSIEEYFSQVEEIVDKHGWKLTREVCLGLVSFLKISMYHDLNNNQLMLTNHPVIRAMAGDRYAIGELPAMADRFDFDSVKPGEWHEVVDADSSQEEAILLSKLGVSFVMQGPPGTGKSQTITNIIAEALADGKKVLFVSEKAAALEVVLKRLTEVHLDDFCLSLHNYKANKKEIIDSIGANLSLEPEPADRAALNELTELFLDREFLTKYADELHQVIEPLGESVYMVFGKLSKLEKATAISFHFDDSKSITREQYSSLLYVLSALERALHNLGGTLDSNVWHGTTAKSSGQTFKQQLIQETAGLSRKLRELDEKVTAINDEYGTKIGHSWKSVEKSIIDVEAALDLPLFPYWWSELAKRDALLSGVRREASAHRSLAASMQNCRGFYHDSILDAPLDDCIKRAGEILDSYRAIGYPAYCAYLPARIMYNCILLPIEAETQDTALRIFSTLNDRGLPLSDSDIFKAQFYKIYTARGEKDAFIARWKDLEALCEKIFHPISGTPMDELFTRYMYFERAKMGIKSSTTEALRKFYEKDGYALLKKDGVFENLITLAYFWNDVANQNNERFSEEILRKLFVLNYAPNGMWTYFVSVYFMQNKDKDGLLEDTSLLRFLDKITAFIWTYAVTNPGVNALRTPVYAEMVNVVNGLPVEFSDYRFDLVTVKNVMTNFGYYNARPITKAMLTWWAYTMPEQTLYSLETPLEIEHIYARNRNEKEHSLTDSRNVEMLGNKALLEKKINIRASDYRFEDKKSFYKGYINKRGQPKEGTKIVELLTLAAEKTDFTEADIKTRNEQIINKFLDYLRKNGLERS